MSQGRSIFGRKLLAPILHGCGRAKSRTDIPGPWEKDRTKKRSPTRGSRGRGEGRGVAENKERAGEITRSRR